MVRRVVLVVLLSVLSISFWAPDLSRAFGLPVGFNQRQTIPISNVIARSADTPTRLRLIHNGSVCWTLEPGGTCEFDYRSDGTIRHERIVTEAEPRPGTFTVIFRGALAIIFLLVGASLLLLRPSPATWAFFVLSLFGWTPNNVFTFIGPPWWQIIANILDYVWETCIPFAGVVFALYLLQPLPLVGWRRIALRSVYAFVATVAAALALSTLLITLAGVDGLLYPTYLAYDTIGVAGAAITPVFLAITYAQSLPAVKERVRWVLLGFSIAAVALVLSLAGLLAGSWLPYPAYAALNATYTFAVTTTTAYAVLRHRIVDVNIVISRAIVYGCLSGIVVALFALMHLFFTRVLAERDAGLIPDVAFALVIGFFFNTLHRRVDRFVDTVIFRKRHVAETHVTTVAGAMRYAASRELVNQMLIEEPVRCFDFAFGMLASCTPERELVVIQASDAPGTIGTRVPASDALIAYLLAERKALRLSEHLWSAAPLTVAAVAPSIAVPVFSHDDIAAVAFYAPHRNGSDLDDGEVALLESAATAGGAAYDRLEVLAMRKRFEELGLAAYGA